MTSDQTYDEHFVARALKLAQRGKGCVGANPMVGAVLVKNGEIIGKGYHQRYGEPHAEVIAIADAGDQAGGSTLYVNLEPCSHYGKTPPCVEAIIEAGIARVVAGMQDPNPLVNGMGFEFLAKKGIEVVCGVLEKECQKLNEAYVKYITTGIPFITLKIAQTIDGRIATSTGHSRWITCEAARTFGYHLRAEHAAVLVGAGTVRSDDPKLTLHGVKGSMPHRIVLDDIVSVPLDSQLLTDEYVTKTIIITTPRASPKKIKRIEERGGKVIILEVDEEGKIPILTLWKTLASMEISTVLVEGGRQVFTSILKSGYADRLVVFIAPKILGNGVNAIGELGIKNVNSALELNEVSIRNVGTDFLLEGRFKGSTEK